MLKSFVGDIFSGYYERYPSENTKSFGSFCIMNYGDVIYTNKN